MNIPLLKHKKVLHFSFLTEISQKNSKNEFKFDVGLKIKNCQKLSKETTFDVTILKINEN